MSSLSKKRLFSIREACEYASVGKSTIYNAINAGILTKRKVFGATRIEVSELKNWIEGRHSDAGL
jgi:excisionase family DNA binding protein